MNASLRPFTLDQQLDIRQQARSNDQEIEFVQIKCLSKISFPVLSVKEGAKDLINLISVTAKICRGNKQWDQCGMDKCHHGSCHLIFLLFNNLCAKLNPVVLFFE